MAKMNLEEFENAVLLFERKKLRESKITLKFMDLYVVNKGSQAELEEYSKLADDDDYLKDIKVAEGKTPRKGRDAEKIRKWFFDKYSKGYEFEPYTKNEGETVVEPASAKLIRKLAGMKF